MEQIVSLQFKRDLTVNINGEFKDNKEMQKEIERQVLALLTEKFPAYSYSLNDTTAVTFENVKPGMVVKSSNVGSIGIVLGINKKTINVAFKNGVMQGHPTAFKLVDSEDFKIKDIMWERPNGFKDSNSWYEGQTGYLLANGEIYQVVLSHSRNKYKAIVINGTNSYSLSESQVESLMFDTEAEAKAKIK